MLHSDHHVSLPLSPFYNDIAITHFDHSWVDRVDVDQVEYKEDSGKTDLVLLEDIMNKIYTIQGVQINPDHFCFLLTKEELENWKSQNVMSIYRKYLMLQITTSRLEAEPNPIEMDINVYTHVIIGNTMVNMTITVPQELKNDLDLFPEINWSEVARQAFREKVGDLKFLIEYKKNSQLTEEDALRLGKEVNRSLHKRYSEME